MPLPIRNLFRRQDSANTARLSTPAQTTNGPAVLEEYQLSEMSDDGVFLPPTPTIREASCSSSKRSRQARLAIPNDTSNDFTISRHSFDSYRRSFDVATRPNEHGFPRQSVDSAPRLALAQHRSSPLLTICKPGPTDDEFEDTTAVEQTRSAATKKTGFFSRFLSSPADSSSSSLATAWGSSASPAKSALGLRSPGDDGAAGELAEMQPIDKKTESKSDAEPGDENADPLLEDSKVERE